MIPELLGACSPKGRYRHLLETAFSGHLLRTLLRTLFWETGGILFREYLVCFGEENSLSFTEFWGKLGEFCEKLGEFALAHKYKAERNSLSSLPRTRCGPKNSLSSVFETVLSETIFGPFPIFTVKPMAGPPSQNPPENPSPEPFPEPFAEPFAERCVAVRPLRRAPNG